MAQHPRGPDPVEFDPAEFDLEAEEEADPALLRAQLRR
jgi:hypothetical protein